MARKIIGRESGMWKWMSALSRTATCGRWPSALDRSRCTRSTRSKTSAAAPQRWAVWGDRYVCVIHGQETNLWMEKGRWFVEAKLVAEA